LEGRRQVRLSYGMSRPERRTRQFEPKNIKRGFLGSGALHVLAFGVLLSLPVVLYRQIERRSPPQIEVNFVADALLDAHDLPEPMAEVEVVPPDDFEARLKEAEVDPQLQEVEVDWQRRPSPLQSWPADKPWLTSPDSYQQWIKKPKVSVIEIKPAPPQDPQPKTDPPPKAEPIAPVPPTPPTPAPSVSATVKRPDPVPDPKASPDPVYPWQALRRRLQGVTQVLVEVDIFGKVVTARVSQTSGHGILDRAALDAVKKWTFLPALKDGKPVPGAAVIPVNFHFKPDGMR
jgi:TonB family protein